MATESKGTSIPFSADRPDGNAKYFGWRTGRGVRIALIISSHSIKLGPRIQDKYDLDKVAACFKTKFIFPLLEKLVVIMSDGKYVVLKGSVAELVETGGRLAETNTGGTALDEIHDRLNEVARFKIPNGVPQACLQESPYVTLFIFVALSIFIALVGPSMRNIICLMLLFVLLAYEMYCIASLKRFIKTVTKS